MILLALEVILMLAVILGAAQLFTNALEHLGARLQISDGVTGSIFAAVGTALPETTVPLLALIAGTADARVNEEIGVGAILGAPLMLSTLSTCLMALAALGARGLRGVIAPERGGFVRDMNFFLLAFAIAASAMYVPGDARSVRLALSLLLVLLYGGYVTLTMRASAALVREGNRTEPDRRMFLETLGLPRNMAVILIQLGLGVALLIAGAKGFIDAVESAARALGISALLLSLLIIPIATELPEKVNSILWVRRDKDTLAFGNITGAMVFQGTLLPAIGITLTPWQPRIEVLSGVAVTLIAAAWLRLNARRCGLALWALMVNGLLYLAYLVITL